MNPHRRAINNGRCTPLTERMEFPAASSGYEHFHSPGTAAAWRRLVLAGTPCRQCYQGSLRDARLHRVPPWLFHAVPPTNLVISSLTVGM